MHGTLDRLSLKADDEDLSVSSFRSIVCLNIPYYCGGGLPLGGHYDLSQCCDQEIEIVAFTGIIHILAAKVQQKEEKKHGSNRVAAAKFGLKHRFVCSLS